MGQTPSSDKCPGENSIPNESYKINGTLGPGLFWLALLGGIAITLLLIVNVVLNKKQLKAGPRSGITAAALVMFIAPAIYYIRIDPNEYAPRSQPCINLNEEFVDRTFWPRVGFFALSCVMTCVGCGGFLGIYAIKPVQAELHEDDIESFDPRTHIYR